jgi:hypothetical protein
MLRSGCTLKGYLVKTSLFDSLPDDFREHPERFEPAAAEWALDAEGMWRGARSFPSGTPLALACAWLGQLRSFWYSALVRLSDGRSIVFYATGFSRLEEEGFSFGERHILLDSEQPDPKENSLFYVSSIRLDRPFPGTRWLPGSSVLLGPRLDLAHRSASARLDALIALGISRYLRLGQPGDQADERRHAEAASALDARARSRGYQVEGLSWEGDLSTIGGWLAARIPGAGFIYVEGEVDLIEAAERSWLLANGHKDPLARNDAGGIPWQCRQPGDCLLEGGAI